MNWARQNKTQKLTYFNKELSQNENKILIKKYLYILPIPLLLFTLLSLWYFPYATPALGIASLLFSLAIAILFIFEKHKQAENPHSKITKDILVLIFTLLLIIFLSGLAGMFANHYVSLRFGAVAGFVSAILVSFAVGFAVRWGVGKLSRE